jgi:hypothetical protein
MFSGLVSKNLAQLDTLNMTMINNEGFAVALQVKADKNSALANEDQD